MEVLYKMFVEQKVVVYKPNPVNELCTAPMCAKLFGRLAADGFFAVVRGGAEVGRAVLEHAGVDEALMTGGAATYDRIVWGGAGGAAEVARNKAAGRKQFTKPFEAELGAVTPWIVVPGRWTAAEMAQQAGRLAMAKKANGGAVCASPQVVVVDADWPQLDEYIDAVRAAFRRGLPSPMYYPGWKEREAHFREALGGDERCERVAPAAVPAVDGELAVTLAAAAPAESAQVTREEAFAPVLTVVRLQCGNDPARFLQAATEYANEKLFGTLSGTLIIDDRTAATHAEALENAIAALEYGTLAVNTWSLDGATQFLTPWGAFPKHTQEDIQSGMGIIGNFRLYDHPEKTVIRKKFFDTKLRTELNAQTNKLLCRVAWLQAYPSYFRLLPLLSAAVLGI